MFRRLLLILLSCLTLSALAETVAVVNVEQNANFAEFARLLEADLAKPGGGLQVRRLASAAEIDPAARVVVAVGSRSLLQALAAPKGAAVVAALTPSPAFEALSGRGRATAVFLDQPPARQLALLRLLLPEAKRVGLLISRDLQRETAGLQRAAEAAGLSLQITPVDGREGLFDALQLMTARSDVVLGWPDSAIFNAQTIQNILLTTYRQRQPLVGFSAAYTRAGAIASVHSSLPQMAAQTADLVRATLAAGGALPAPQYPKEFEVTVNRQVGRSLGIELPDERVLVDQMRAREGKLKP